MSEVPMDPTIEEEHPQDPKPVNSQIMSEEGKNEKEMKLNIGLPSYSSYVQPAIGETSVLDVKMTSNGRYFQTIKTEEDIATVQVGPLGGLMSALRLQEIYNASLEEEEFQIIEEEDEDEEERPLEEEVYDGPSTSTGVRH